jgi:hypothetical protein
MRSYALAAVALSILLRATGAQATLTLYTSEASFLAQVGTLTVEGFEAAPFGPVPSYTSGALTTSTANANLNATNIPLLISQGGRSIYWNDAAQHGDLIFQLAAPISAFAIDIKNLGATRGPTTLSASVDGGAFFDVFTNVSGPQGNLRFVGLVEDAGSFSQIRFSNSTLGDLTGVDRAQYGIVPEPATAALLAVGLTALGVRARRHR